MDHPCTPTPAAEPAPLDAAAAAQIAHHLATMALDLATDAERSAHALAGLMELLRASNAEATLTAAFLAELVDPIFGAVDTLAMDTLALVQAARLVPAPDVHALHV